MVSTPEKLNSRSSSSHFPSELLEKASLIRDQITVVLRIEQKLEFSEDLLRKIKEAVLKILPVPPPIDKNTLPKVSSFLSSPSKTPIEEEFGATEEMAEIISSVLELNGIKFTPNTNERVKKISREIIKESSALKNESF
jgi:hypothetical protein